MSSSDVIDEESFRREVLSFLETTLARKGETDRSAAKGVTRAKEYQRQLADAGLAGITWPTEFGGRGLPGRFQRIFDQAARAYAVPPRSLEIGLGMCGPTILAHGSEVQKKDVHSAALARRTRLVRIVLRARCGFGSRERGHQGDARRRFVDPRWSKGLDVRGPVQRLCGVLGPDRSPLPRSARASRW